MRGCVGAKWVFIHPCLSGALFQRRRNKEAVQDFLAILAKVVDKKLGGLKGSKCWDKLRCWHKKESAKNSVKESSWHNTMVECCPMSQFDSGS